MSRFGTGWWRRSKTPGFGNAITDLDSAIRALFANGEQGAWYDPSDLSTLFQDAAGTTPVTAAGQPVGKILDKSGRGNHATQATAASRPVLQQDGNGKYYLAFDGVDDLLSTGSINFTATDKMTVVAGVRKLSDAATGMVLELSAVSGNYEGTFALRAPDGAATNFAIYSRGSAPGAGAIYTNAAVAAPVSAVVAGAMDIASDGCTLRVNGSAVATSPNNQGTGNFGNYPLYIGRRAGIAAAFNGRIYQLIVRGAYSTDAQLSQAETFVNSKTGAY